MHCTATNANTRAFALLAARLLAYFIGISMLSKISELSIYFAYTHYASSVYELVFHSRSDVAKQTRNPAVARIADRNGCQ